MLSHLHHWYVGARPRTLPASVVPVVMGTAVASTYTSLSWWAALAAMVVALSLQIGVNYANDYSDGIRGTDENRAGPLRLVASGLASARAVRFAAFTMFGVAAAVGIVLSVSVDWRLLIVGALAIPAAWFYTGGPRPYGYAGFGEVFVFVFFGLVATLGSEYVQNQDITAAGVGAGVCAGLLAVALLLVNNLRDIDGDADAGKKTLVVRAGLNVGRCLYTISMLFPFAVVAAVAVAADRMGLLITLAAVVMAAVPLRLVWTRTGRGLLPALAATGRTQLLFGALFCVGVVL